MRPGHSLCNAFRKMDESSRGNSSGVSCFSPLLFSSLSSLLFSVACCWSRLAFAAFGGGLALLRGAGGLMLRGGRGWRWVQPRQVHKNAVNGIIENVNFLFCPPERLVVVPVPVKVCYRGPLLLVGPARALLPLLDGGRRTEGAPARSPREESGNEGKGQTFDVSPPGGWLFLFQPPPSPPLRSSLPVGALGWLTARACSIAAQKDAHEGSWVETEKKMRRNDRGPKFDEG